uniref:ATP synthase complex subunit 8 n=1 Tax=Oryctes rhinoceros TaxID=72550 RepID=A0A7D4XT76_ORYRH|nr:ATP synthase F0 subunit 8 [Oryctes rhinoceros]QKX48645.1 ATP synthase protein 8 [Oryctes rhinoceros]QSZ78105.1 ATP synthase subunit 8 [Oryctes rhinoceros]WAT94188.1 ATP synthase F0 subunit 8 [Oryctes rhinoceros]WDA95529.1 ATP synthase F0 subunit 8 [Oryctes rhinoceros]WDA95542.1 ATP synthase F0 subunit 8 [Oryctes rhinoceros]
MPQMAPLNWLSLFFMFVSIFLIYNAMNYFSFMYPVKQPEKKKTIKKINWKW